MVDMGIEPFNVAVAVNLITAQRLVRRICSKCKEPVTYPGVPRGRAAEEEREGCHLLPRRAATTAAGSGYKGRQGLYEVMAMSPTLRRMILQGASTAELQEQAISEGMLTLRMDGMEEGPRGITTLEEVMKETAGSAPAPIAAVSVCLAARNL
jgi:type IV pilus assembly protein PilB